MRRSSPYARVYGALRAVRDRYPALQAPLRAANKLLGVRPPVRFAGWGMTTAHALPWDDDPQWSHFAGTLDGLRGLVHTGEAGIHTGLLDELRWRHWVVAFAVHSAIALTSSREDDPVCLAECGVADGVTAYVALREAAHRVHSGATMHLYDAWQRIDPGSLGPGERSQRGKYSGLSVDVARANLAPFADHCTFHVGYVPASFYTAPDAPASVDYLHVDLNAAGPTKAACEFFWPRLRPGGVMLFDDYGWLGFEDTRRAVDAFFAGKPGALLKMPTAQAIFFRRR